MIRTIIKIECDACDEALAWDDGTPLAEAQQSASKRGWFFNAENVHCPACVKKSGMLIPEDTAPAPCFEMIIGNLQGASRYNAFNVWAKEIENIDLAKQGGYAFTGDQWIAKKLIANNKAFFYGKITDFKLVVVGYQSLSHECCWIVETLAGVSHYDTLGFGRKETAHSIFIDVKNGRVVFTATGKQPKNLVEQAVKWGATAEMLKKVVNPNFYAAMYLWFNRDEWKFKGNPYAIEIEEK